MCVCVVMFCFPSWLHGRCGVFSFFYFCFYLSFKVLYRIIFHTLLREKNKLPPTHFHRLYFNTENTITQQVHTRIFTYECMYVLFIGMVVRTKLVRDSLHYEKTLDKRGRRARGWERLGETDSEGLHSTDHTSLPHSAGRQVKLNNTCFIPEVVRQSFLSGSSR